MQQLPPPWLYEPLLLLPIWTMEKFFSKDSYMCTCAYTCTHLIFNNNKNHLPAYGPLLRVPHPSSSAFLHTSLVLFALTLLQLDQPSEPSHGTQNTRILMIQKQKLQHKVHTNQGPNHLRIALQHINSTRQILPTFPEVHSFLMLTSWGEMRITCEYISPFPSDAN